MNLNQLRAKLEEKSVEQAKETYKQQAGLDYSQEKIERIGAEQEELSKKALKEFTEEETPRDLYISLVTGSIAEELTEISNKIYRKRTEEIKAKANGEEVTLSNWRTWNSKHVEQYEKRKEIFNQITSQSHKVSDLVKKGFDLEKKKMQEHDLDPLQAYLEKENVSKEKLIDLVESSAKKAKDRFQEIKDRYSEKAIGKGMEYYDDFYIYRHTIYKPFDPVFKDIDYREKMHEVFKGLGFDLSKIKIDSEKREGKTPSPMCMSIQVPNDVRVLYQETSPFGDFSSYCHEMGHALHGSSIKEDLTFEERYIIPMGIAEIFSTLFESLATNELFLKEELNMDSGKIQRLKERKRFMDLFYLAFYGANSQMKIEYWDRDYSIEEATERYGELYKKYVGEEIPGEYWLVHHVMPMYDIYSPSYLLAHIRKSELLNKIKNEYREDWWRSEEAGEYIKEDLMAPGSNTPVEDFSNLNKDIYLNSILQ